MSEEQNIDYELIAKHFAGESSEEENTRLEVLCATDPEYRNAVDALRQVYEQPIVCTDECADTDAAWKKVEARIASKTISFQRQPGTSQKWWAMAATILAVAGLALVFYLIAFNRPETILLTADAGKLEAVLPDGSTVVLREGSTLSYPKTFEDSERKVELLGEAFFDVTENKNAPFTIETGKAEITVLGTSFFVKALEKDTVVSVLVETGKVRLASKKEKNTSLTLIPGEQGSLNTENKNIRKSKDAGETMGFWMSKTIRFRKTDLVKVAETLTEFFGKEIHLENPGMESCRITATFKDEGLDSILEVIAATLNLQMREEGGKIILSGEGC